MIYLDSASTAMTRPPRVAEAVKSAIDNFASPARGAYDASILAAGTIHDTREKIAALFGVPGGAAQVAFTHNATHALNLAVSAIPNPRKIVTTVWEHNSVLRPLKIMRDRGCQVIYQTDPEKIPDGADAVICTHASNVTGDVFDIGAIGKRARDAGAMFIADAAQTAGILPIDMKNIDILCFSGHKGLLGPQGTGGICVKKGLRVAPLIVGGSGNLSAAEYQPEDMPAALEAGTPNAHGIAGLNAALEWLRQNGLPQITLAREFCGLIKDIPGIEIYGDRGAKVPIVSLNIGDMDAGKIAMFLFEKHGICARSGLHCAPMAHKTLGTADRGALRFTFSRFNTFEETKIAAEALYEISKN